MNSRTLCRFAHRATLAFAAACLLALPGRVAAEQNPSASVKAGGLVIEQPWSRAPPGGAKVGGGYVRITNTGTVPDRLVGGSFSASAGVELHDMTVSDGIMRMKPVEGGLAIAPGATLELKPGGLHAMFIGLQRPLKEGERIAGTLLFEKAGPVPVTYTVRSLGAQGAGEDHSHHH